MPILEIEIVLKDGETLAPTLACALADAAGQVFGSPPAGTWVRLRGLPGQQYAENDSPPGPHPVFVSVLKARMASAEATQAEVSRLTPLIAKLCDRPAENVHIIYQPEGFGRAAFGGELLSE